MAEGRAAITSLNIPGCPNVSDLSLLKESPLKHLHIDFKAERDGELLRSIKTLATINGKPSLSTLHIKGSFSHW